MNEQSSESNREPELNISDSSLSNVQIGGVAGRDLNLNQIQGEVVHVTVQDNIDVAESLGQNKRSSTTTKTSEEYLFREKLLRTVKDDWIEGYLKQSLHIKVLIELGLKKRSNAVVRPSKEGLVDLPIQPKDTSFEEADAIEIFEQMGIGRTLLILGEPGSGKTITLLKIAESLVAKSELDTNRSIPVILNLSSWSIKQKPIDEWLLDELFLRYGISNKKLSQKWVKNQQLILLLDGLDEVKQQSRNDCVRALNKFIRSYGLIEIVICCRLQDYELLSERLTLKGAVCIQPLSIEQVYHYLDRADDKDDKLAKTKAAIKQNSTLQELAISPLILNLMILVSQDQELDEMLKTDSTQKYLALLFDIYIEKMFLWHPASQKYSQEKTKLWLIWLAKKMNEESQSTFYIENLQPSWLEKNFSKILYVSVVTLNPSIINYLIGEASIKILLPVSIPAKDTYTILMFSLVMYWVFFGVMCGNLIQKKDFILFRKVNDFWKKITFNNNMFAKYLAKYGNLVNFYYRIVWRNSYIPEIELIEKVSWSFGNAIKRFVIHFLLFAITIALFISSVSIVIFSIIAIGKIIASFGSAELGAIISSYLRNLLIVSLFFSPVISLLLTILFLPYIFVFSGITLKINIKEPTYPNQGIWQSAKNTFLFGIFALVVAVIILFLNKTLSGYWLSFWFLSLFNGFLVLGTLSGAAGYKHFVLRSILYFRQKIPWNYARFLDYATERLFLQKVGGGYIFIHRMLMEHFASIKPEPK